MKLLSSIIASSIFVLGTFIYSVEAKEGPAIIDYESIHHPVVAKHGMVASQQHIASDVGVNILKRGGNAVDAAVATGLALAVVLPRAGNLGGGGFMLVHLKEQGKTIAIDYREVAPIAAHRNLFLDSDGNVDKQKARFSRLSAGVPGTVAGLYLAQQQYGTMDWAEVIQPAIQLAEEGFVVNWDLANQLERRSSYMKKIPATAKVFFKEGGDPYETGDLLKQKDLATTLKLLQKEGAKAFYQGKIAKLIVADMKKNGGIITTEDLANYKPVIRKPLTGQYRDHTVVTMPPASSGGVHLIQMLNVLEHFPVADLGVNTADSINVMSEAMKYAYADRSKHLGDTNFYDVPLDWLMSKKYAETIAKKVTIGEITPSTEINAGTAPKYESPDTTHFSVVDQWGNAVSNTYTLNFSYGSGIVAEGTGILLNNEMDDFSAKPGTPNAYGLIGGEANAIEAGKRPLSSMTPAMVFKDGQLKLVTGSPGGSRIITTVLQMVVNFVDHGMNVAEATHTPRFHHQWLPDRVFVEPAINKDTRELLKQRGYELYDSRTMGSTQSIQIEDYIYGSSDPRRPNAKAAGY
ncbi:gamma-glutamyltransferase [Kangiella sediminilitoris]|uniref:Glutathione hydrolase proenzyme n=1 Tax=Kangiella sediminilitoris TaxID=1144748 RepID=A0A1B3BBG5_9GAMM|nr:gamma-glutamyltransferase [Kangiella sediminilitoris]AOE50129.1 Gamma-glutamyltransferase [Kangiella sediminilitoris]